MRARSLNAHSEKTRVSEVGVDGTCGINEVIIPHQIGLSEFKQSLHEEESGCVAALPGHRLEGHVNVGLRALSPSAELTTDVL